MGNTSPSSGLVGKTCWEESSNCLRQVRKQRTVGGQAHEATVWPKEDALGMYGLNFFDAEEAKRSKEEKGSQDVKRSAEEDGGNEEEGSQEEREDWDDSEAACS